MGVRPQVQLSLQSACTSACRHIYTCNWNIFDCGVKQPITPHHNLIIKTICNEPTLHFNSQIFLSCWACERIFFAVKHLKLYYVHFLMIFFVWSLAYRRFHIKYQDSILYTCMMWREHSIRKALTPPEMLVSPLVSNFHHFPDNFGTPQYQAKDLSFIYVPNWPASKWKNGIAAY